MADSNPEQMMAKVDIVKRRRAEIELMGGEARVEAQHKAGRLTARERMELFFDPGTFIEIDAFARCTGRDFGMDKVNPAADGVITGYGQVSGRVVAAFAQDFTCIGGTMGEMHGKKIAKITEMAGDWGVPCIGFHESGGARLQEFLAVSREYGNLFYLNSIYSGVIPQISAMCGVVAGGQTYSPGLTDFVFMTRNGAAFIAGPALVQAVVGEEIGVDDLGGTKLHSTVSGVCHVVAEDDNDCVEKIKDLLSYLPSNNREKPPRIKSEDSPDRTNEKLYQIVPASSTTPYDMHKVIYEITDGGRFFEIHKGYARSMVIGMARFDGQSVGIVANNPSVQAGAITTKAAEKAARFIRFCDAFSIPIVYLVATPAYLIGSEMEREGMIFRGATLLYATSEATVPQITINIGWAYAGAFIAMGSKYLKSDVVYAWPTAEIGLVAAEGVVNVVFRKEIAQVEDKEAERKKREEEFRNTFMDIMYPASYQHVDDIIDPKDTRRRIVQSLKVLEKKKVELPWKKHGNTPL
ncbi:MAG: acyl-CoA carboxylase subunit beta [Dehalococcoidia bacterium]|jgi:acetyl-CoA carboxylase carboxyltransferase component|nr:acyl-CoA carboxylase subunit beta [Dehalococcoidia bacterium]MDP6782615.1 acyl-CoA carboxylase subunit beta [Dehalococcoidia bacterium]